MRIPRWWVRLSWFLEDFPVLLRIFEGEKIKGEIDTWISSSYENPLKIWDLELQRAEISTHTGQV